MSGDRPVLQNTSPSEVPVTTVTRTPFRYVPCPSSELVLLGDGRLLIVPVRGREQLQVDAPWGRLVHQVVVEGRSVTDCVAPEDVELFDATLRHLAAHGVLVPAARVASADVERFDRQVRWFAQEGANGPRAQRRLAAATVLVLGVGGFGSAVAELLARAGVGRLVLADDDRVETVNIPRQLLYGDRDVGARKSYAAAARIEQIAPDIEAVPVEAEIACSDDVARLVRRHRPDLLVCAADRPPIAIKGWVDDGAFAGGIPVLHGGSRPPFAYVGPLLVPGVTSCYQCFLASRCAVGAEELEQEVNALRDASPPSLPAAGWCDVTAASLSVAQAVAYLAGVHDPSVLGREFELDARTFATEWMEPLPERGELRCDRCAS